MKLLTWKRIKAGVYKSETVDGFGFEIYKVETLEPCNYTASYGGYCWNHARQLVGGLYAPTKTGPDSRKSRCGGNVKRPVQWRLKARLQTNDHCVNTWFVEGRKPISTVQNAKVIGQSYFERRTAEAQRVRAS